MVDSTGQADQDRLLRGESEGCERCHRVDGAGRVNAGNGHRAPGIFDPHRRPYRAVYERDGLRSFVPGTLWRRQSFYKVTPF